MEMPKWFDLPTFTAMIAALGLIPGVVSLLAMFYNGWFPKFLAEPEKYWPRRFKRRLANSHCRWVINYEVDLKEAEGYWKVRYGWIREVRLRRKVGYAVLMQKIDVGEEGSCQHSSSSLVHVCTEIPGDEYRKLLQALSNGETTDEYLRHAIAVSLEDQENRK